MANFETFTQTYLEEFDEITSRHTDAYRSGIARIYAEADLALISAGRILAPNHVFAAYTNRQLDRFRQTIVGRPGYDSLYEVYRIEPGSLGPTPANLQPGEKYLVRGFLTSNLVCSTLANADSTRRTEGAVEFPADSWYGGRLDYFDGQALVYAGYQDERCQQCREHIPHHEFKRVLADGSFESDQYGDPLVYTALDDMITVVEQPDSPSLAA